MIGWFIKHPTASNLIMGLFLLLGVMTAFRIKREVMPDFSDEKVTISIAYPGATAEEVEEAVCAPVEEALQNVNNVKEIVSSSREGAGTVTVEMEEGSNFIEFYNDIKTEVEAIDSFPNEVENIIIKPQSRTDHVFSIAITGNMSTTHLKEYCEQVKERIKQTVGGVMIDVEGFSQHEFRIELSPEMLYEYKLSVKDIANTIKNQNTDLPAGTLETGDRDILLRFNDRRKTVSDLADMRIVSGASGGEITLGQIAKITDRFELDEEKVLFNGKRAGILNISKSKSRDSLKIYDAINKLIDKIKVEAPPGVKFYTTRNAADSIRDRLRLLTENGIQGIILVFLTLWLFLNIRLAFWVSMGLPISFLGGLFFMNLFGISLNMISMVALLIAIGLLMDDAIVLSENIAVRLRKGDKALDAAINGVKEVASGVLSSFATTACVFLPLMFTSGKLGKILSVIPITLLLVLSVSLVEAFFIMPNHLAHSFKDGLGKPFGARIYINRAVDWIRLTLVGGLIKRLIPHRYLFLGCVAALFVLSLAMPASGVLKYIAFPDVDGDTVSTKVLLPQGTPLARSEAVAAKLVTALTEVNEYFKPQQPGGVDLINNISIQFSVNNNAGSSGPNMFTVLADLLPGDERNASVNEVLAKWRECTGELSGVQSISYDDFQMGPAGNPIEIRLRGKSLDELKKASLTLQKKLNSYDGVFDVSDDMLPGKPEVIMKLKPGSLKLGLSAAAIAGQLRAAFHGSTADELQIGSENYEYNVRLSKADINNVKRFDNFRVTAPDGRKIPLAAVVDMKSGRGLSTINRIDGMRTVTVTADVEDAKANGSEVIGDLRKKYFPDFLKEYPGINISYGGATKRSAETGSSMGTSFLIGVAGIFILLALQFRSYMEPLAIMVAIPLAVIGAIWGHICFGISFSMPSLMGFISLSGIVVNDSILMMEFIKMREREGGDLEEALVTAGSDRFRALMLTSLTTVAGLLPLLAEKSMQAQTLIPLAISIVTGLTASTLLVLFVIPTFYMVIQDFRRPS